MYFIDKLKAACGFDSPKMIPHVNSPVVNMNYVSQHVINCEDNIAFVERVWNERHTGKENKYDVVYSNPLRAEYHKLFNCISRCQKMMKKFAKEKQFEADLIACKERSIPEMVELIGNLNARISSIHPIPYMWNHEQQREVIGNLNMKWEEMALQDYLCSVVTDDEESDNEMSFDEKYGIDRTKLSDITTKSIGALYNERLKNEVLALEREERQLQKSLLKSCADLMQPFTTASPIEEMRRTILLLPFRAVLPSSSLTLHSHRQSAKMVDDFGPSHGFLSVFRTLRASNQWYQREIDRMDRERREMLAAAAAMAERRRRLLRQLALRRADAWAFPLPTRSETSSTSLVSSSSSINFTNPSYDVHNSTAAPYSGLDDMNTTEPSYFTIDRADGQETFGNNPFGRLP